MKLLVQIFIGSVIGVISLRTLSGWFRADDSFSTSFDESRRGGLGQHLDVDKLTRDDIEGGVAVHKELAEFAERFENSEGELNIIKVTDGIYHFRGSSKANIVVMEGPEGLIVVDTSESPSSAEKYLSALRQINQKPIKAIILTHQHLDHIAGLEVFIEDKANPPDIWSHHTSPQISKASTPIGPKAFRGAVYQFGMALSDKSDFRWPAWIPQGSMGSPRAARTPNRLIVNDVEHVEIAGLNMTFFFAPGESDDHINIWLPQSRVLISADNVYNSFPNIYAIRGVARDALRWVRALRQMRSYGAEFMVPLHGPSVSGRQEIYDLLTIYSSGIEFVHDQTVRRINELHHPNELGRLVQFPPTLASNLYLRSHYGFVEGSAKSIYQQYLGWFSGDPADLMPLTPSERAQSMIDWLGIDRILDEAENALYAGKTQWSLELSGQVRRVRPENLRARWLWTQSLRQRAAEQINGLTRNYYLTAALDSNGLVDWKLDLSALKDDIGVPLKMMKYRLKAELTDGVNSTIHLHFTDSISTYRLQIQYSVLHVELLSSDTRVEDLGDTTISTTETVWLDILLRKINAATAYMNGQIKITGSVQDVRTFMSYF